MNYSFTIKNITFKNIILSNLKLLILITPVVVNKNIYNFKVNQETSLKLFTIILFSSWILRIMNIGNLSWKRNKINLPIFLFIFLMTISLLNSQTILVSLRDYIIWISYFFIYFLLINNIDSEQINSFIKLFFITSFIVAIYTLIQYYGLDPYLKETNILTSTLGQKNWISNYLSMIFPLIFTFFLLEGIKKNKIVYFLLLSMIYTTLMICQSRGIWISIIITDILAIYIIFKFNLLKIFHENKKWLALLLLTFLTITIIYSTDNLLNKSAITVTERAMSTFDEQDPSINTRLLIWKTTFEMIKDKLLLGSGIGTFKINYLNYQAKYLKSNPNYIKYWAYAGESHNEYLQIGAELGMVGLGVFILAILFFYNLSINFLKKEKVIEKKIVFLGFLMGITCFLIHSLFTFPFHVPALGVTFFILFGLAVIYVGKFNLYEINEKNKSLKKINLKESKIKIPFTILIFILTIFLINILVIKPYISEIYYFKGVRYTIDKNYNQALFNFKNAARFEPYNERILHALGTTYYELNIFDKAKVFLQKAKKIIIDINTIYNLGLIYFRIGSYKEAEEEFKYVIYLNPNFSEAYYSLGFLYFSQEDYGGAIEQWNKILEIEPNFPNKYIVLNNLGIVYNKKEMPDKALEYFLQALQLAPEGSSIIEEIEKEIYNIYKGQLEK